MSLPQEIKELTIKVELEMLAQIDKWGDQRHQSFASYMDTGCTLTPIDRARYYCIPREKFARMACETAFSEGDATYAHIFVEEVAEAIGAENDDDLEAELIQVAAVALNWIRSIRHNRANGA